MNQICLCMLAALFASGIFAQADVMEANNAILKGVVKEKGTDNHIPYAPVYGAPYHAGLSINISH